MTDSITTKAAVPVADSVATLTVRLRCLCRYYGRYACPTHAEHPAYALTVRLSDCLDGEPRVQVRLSGDRSAVVVWARHDVNLGPWRAALGIAPGRLRGEVAGVTTHLAIKRSDRWLAPLY